MSKNINDEVAKRIKIFIQHLGITTAEFCRKTGLSRQTVDKFKAGIHGPSVESLDKIIKSYPELRLNWLVSGEGMMVERITDDEEDFLIKMYEMEVKSKKDPRLTMSFVSAVQWFAQEHKELEQLDTNIKVLSYNEGEHAEFRASLLLYQSLNCPKVMESFLFLFMCLPSALAVWTSRKRFSAACLLLPIRSLVRLPLM